jgi:ATP-dependent exoDNAse (exonuclease V) beta subunit
MPNPGSNPLQRVPLAFDPAAQFAEARARKLPDSEAESESAAPSLAEFSRPEGSFAARSFGNAMHALLEILARRLAEGATPSALLAELPTWTPRIAAILRADGLPPTTVNKLTRETRAALENVLRDPAGQWLLTPHPGSANELAITAWPAAGNNSTSAHPASIRPASVRVDRIFHGGPEPHTPGKDFLWIVDYKTSGHGGSALDAFLAAQRDTYGPQLEAYVRILAPARSMPLEKVRLALYFPTLPRLTWWKPTDTI